MSPRPFKSQDDSFEDCLELAKSGRHSQAVEALVRALAQTPLHAQYRAAAVEALLQISRLAEAAGERDHAESALLEASRVAPRFADVHHRLGCVRLAAGKRLEARASFEEALRINPRYIAARAELALLDAREGRLAQALLTLRTLGQEATLDEPRVFAHALESLEQADWDEAGDLVRHALHLDEPGIQETIEEFHRRMERGDRPAAAHLVRQALREHQRYADLHYLLGTAELEDSNLDDAISSLACALELHPDYHAARIQLARALETLGDIVQAEEQVALVLQVDPEHPQALELSERWNRMHRRRPMSAARKAS
jgi:tetratricopeptide (TPR) repeat protein